MTTPDKLSGEEGDVFVVANGKLIPFGFIPKNQAQIMTSLVRENDRLRLEMESYGKKLIDISKQLHKDFSKMKKILISNKESDANS